MSDLSLYGPTKLLVPKSGNDLMRDSTVATHHHSVATSTTCDETWSILLLQCHRCTPFPLQPSLLSDIPRSLLKATIHCHSRITSRGEDVSPGPTLPRAVAQLMDVSHPGPQGALLVTEPASVSSRGG